MATPGNPGVQRVRSVRDLQDLQPWERRRLEQWAYELTPKLYELVHDEQYRLSDWLPASQVAPTVGKDPRTLVKHDEFGEAHRIGTQNYFLKSKVRDWMYEKAWKYGQAR